jgi:SAM-dependent methyltransferase
MAAPSLADASFDLIWSEGAFSDIGIENALEVCRSLLKSGGYLAFTEAVWRVNEPPTKAKAMPETDYPEMGLIQDVIAKIAAIQFILVDHFARSSEAWWQDFYTPREARNDEMRSRYHGDPEALAVLDEVAQEPERHRRFSHFYDYEFFVVRLMDAAA